jgi:hypothetical protein
VGFVSRILLRKRAILSSIVNICFMKTVSTNKVLRRIGPNVHIVINLDNTGIKEPGVAVSKWHVPGRSPRDIQQELSECMGCRIRLAI